MGNASPTDLGRPAFHAGKFLVAVIDTGVDVSHPDLSDVVWQNAGEIGLDLEWRG